MMTKVKYSTSILLLILLTACGTPASRKDRVAAMIGEMESPFLVAAFTPENIIDKSGVKDGALPMTYETFVSFLFLESATGIDNSEQVQVVANKGEWLAPNVYAFVPLKDVQLFEAITKKELGAKVQEKDGVKFFRKDKDGYVVAWKDDLAIVTNIPFNLDNIFSKSANDSKKAAVKLVHMINDVDLGNKQKAYRDFFEKEGDFIVYFDGLSAYEMMDRLKFIPAKNKKEARNLLAGTVVQSALTFENGLIKLTGDYDLTDSLLEKVKFISGEGINEGLLAYGETENPELAVAFNIPTDGVVAFMADHENLTEFNTLEKGLGKVGLSLEELEQAFTGACLLMVDGEITQTYTYSIDEESDEVSYKESAVGFVFELKSAETVSAFIESIDEDSTLAHVQSGDMTLLVKGQHLFVSNSESWAAQVVEGTTKTLNNDKGILTSNAFGLVSNEQVKSWVEDEVEYYGMNAEDFKSMWGMASINDAEFQIILKNNDQNALRSIVETFITGYENEMIGAHPQMDSIISGEMLEAVVDGVEEGLEEAVNELERVFK